MMSFTYSITDSEIQEYFQSFYKKTLFKGTYRIYGLIALILIGFNTYKSSINHSTQSGETSVLTVPKSLSWLLLVGAMVSIWFFILWLQRKTSSSKNYWFIYLGIAVCLFWVNAYWGINEGSRSNSSEYSIVGPMLTWVLLIFVMVGLLSYLLMKPMREPTKIEEQDREDVLGERTLTLDNEKIQVKNVISETTLLWNGIKRWEQTPNLYLLFITHNVAHLIPKRVFSTETERQEFETLLKTKVQNLSDGKYLDA